MPLDKVKLRSEIVTKECSTLPNVSEGEYLAIQFQNKKSATEH
jgi:hypothetical protein